MGAGRQKETFLQGLGLSKGCAVGKVCLFDDDRHEDCPRYRVADDEIEKELARVETAHQLVDERLEEISKEVEETVGKAESEIFVVQRMILNDDSIKTEINRHIETEKINAEAAIDSVLREQEKKLSEIKRKDIKARSTDISELKERLLDALRNRGPSLQGHSDSYQEHAERIVVAKELTPALTVELDREFTIGFATEMGGVNSHAAILARGMGVPAVGNIRGLREKVRRDDELLINGETGEVVISPSESTVNKTVAKYPIEHGAPEEVEPVPDIKVLANIKKPDELELCLKMKAEGVGLYRTEFDLLSAGRFLSEDELYRRYLSVRAGVQADAKVVYRMFDVGFDKQLPFMGIPDEKNPSLGWRGSRLLLDRTDMFEAQARALARVSRTGTVHVMYPMIVDLDQFLEIRKRFKELSSDIEAGEIKHGIMFEVPSACMQVQEMFKQIDFGSIGTNDLLQYVFAVDRENEKIACDYNPDHPIFWQLIKDIADTAKQHGKPIAICGELGGEPAFTRKLISLGIREVSVSPRRIPAVRKAAAAAK